MNPEVKQGSILGLKSVGDSDSEWTSLDGAGCAQTRLHADGATERDQPTAAGQLAGMRAATLAEGGGRGS